MKLYIKGERRYREAKDSEVLVAAARIIGGRDIPGGLNDVLWGMAKVMEAQEKNEAKTEALRRAKQEKKP